MKSFREKMNVGRARYVVSFHDGIKKHQDGSKFFDIRIFKNKVVKNRFVKELMASGYVATT
jgi:hypothetical protein